MLLVINSLGDNTHINFPGKSNLRNQVCTGWFEGSNFKGYTRRLVELIEIGFDTLILFTRMALML